MMRGYPLLSLLPYSARLHQCEPEDHGPLGGTFVTLQSVEIALPLRPASHICGRAQPLPYATDQGKASPKVLLAFLLLLLTLSLHHSFASSLRPILYSSWWTALCDTHHCRQLAKRPPCGRYTLFFSRGSWLQVRIQQTILFRRVKTHVRKHSSSGQLDLVLSGGSSSSSSSSSFSSHSYCRK